MDANKNSFRDPSDLPLILKIDDMMEVLDIGRNTAYELIRSGRVYSIRVGNQIRIPKQALLDFIEPSEDVGA